MQATRDAQLTGDGTSLLRNGGACLERELQLIRLG